MAHLAFLGPEGSFTHETALLVAAREGWTATDLLSCDSVPDVVDAVAARTADRGVVPVATSLRGSLEREVAAVAAAEVRETERVERTCRYALLGVEGTSIEEVTTVLSHPEAFADCAGRLTALVSQAEWARTPSTGAAARRVAAEGSRAKAAIAPALAAEIYGLAVLAAGLEDDPNNRTTWAIIGPVE